ncbi:malate dehydrogenase [Alteribacillus sp. JSM 102045]|uniref:malate dehydrogenase n=1 Tax=Alteribacillus sp. JSM 102045 TaxID=1562101 RepID=UPI0035C1B2B8
MSKITIIGGAGTLGAAAAFSLASHENIDEICMIDINENLLKNQVMDLQNAYPAKVLYAGSYRDLVHTDIVIITAGIPNRNDITSRCEFLDGNIKLFKEFGENIQTYAPEALIITASNPLDLLNYYLYENYDFHPRQLAGYTLNDSFRFEWALREALDVPAKDSLFTPVLGEHGESQVPVFSQVTRSGRSFEMAASTQESIRKKLKSWFRDFNSLKINRTTGWTTAAGIRTMVEKMLQQELSEMIGSAIFRGEYGFHGISMGAPLLVNNQGVQQVQEWTLTPAEKENYAHSAHVLKASIEKMKEAEGGSL